MFSKTKSRRKRSLYGSSPGRPIRQIVRRFGREYLLYHVNTAPYNAFPLRFFLEQNLFHPFILPPTNRALALLHMTFTTLVYTLRISGLLLSWHFLYRGCCVRWAVALLLDIIRFLIMNRDTVHFRLLSTSYNMLYAREESIRIPHKNARYSGS